MIISSNTETKARVSRHRVSSFLLDPCHSTDEMDSTRERGVGGDYYNASNDIVVIHTPSANQNLLDKLRLLRRELEDIRIVSLHLML
jgi:hypothetical protein